MKYPNYKFLIKNLIRKGFASKKEEPIEETLADEAIDVFKEVARHDPLFLLNEIFVLQASPMSMLGIAALLSSTKEEFIDAEDIKIVIFEILLSKTPEDLCECLEYIKYGNFLRKLGSRSQKLFRKVMEAWVSPELASYIKEFPEEIKQLCMVIHPRYTNERGEKIKKLIANNN